MEKRTSKFENAPEGYDAVVKIDLKECTLCYIFISRI